MTDRSFLSAIRSKISLRKTAPRDADRAWKPASFDLPDAEMVSHTFWVGSRRRRHSAHRSAGTSIPVNKDIDVWCGWEKRRFLKSVKEENSRKLSKPFRKTKPENIALTVNTMMENNSTRWKKAIQHASESYKKEQADEAIGSFEDKLAAIGGSTGSFAERRQEILSSVTGNSQSDIRLRDPESLRHDKKKRFKLPP